VSRIGSRLKPPMGFAFYQNMTEPGLDAIVAYRARALEPCGGAPDS